MRIRIGAGSPARAVLRTITCALVLTATEAAAQVEESADDVAGAAAATEQVADANAQIEDLRERLALLEQRNAELQEQLDTALAGDGARAEELRALRDEAARQQDQIARQLKDLEQQQGKLDAQEERIAALEETVLLLNTRLLEMQDQLPDSSLTIAMQERLERLETSVEVLPELPAEVVGAGEFPGSMRIPGTDAMLKIGGLVKTSLVYNIDALGSDDRFVTASIPIKGTEEAGKGSRLTLSARSSRFNLDLRTPTGVGHVRAYIEGDFAGEGNTYRLRHAYGQYNRYLFGQTWSNLVDLTAIPEDLDFEGLNAQVLLRQTQLRGIYHLGDQQISVSVENPSADLTGADGVSLIPDIVTGTTWPVGEGHLRTAVILRQLIGEVETRPNETYSQYAWGMSVSGRLTVNDQDDIRFAAHLGEGLGSYINDLGAEGGQDAVMDTVQSSLRTLPVTGAYVAYAHWWKSDRWRSTACFGFVRVRNLDIQDQDSYRQTFRLTANLIYTPAPRMDVGIEFLTGRRENKDRQYGTARQVQLAWYFRF